MKDGITRKENTLVSVAKGIGILLVLIGHFGFIPEVKRFIYLFHMPLFFFLSGYLFKDRELKELPRYVLRKIRSLYVPFIACNLFAMIFHNLFCRIGIYQAEDAFHSVSEVLKYIAKVLLCIKMEDVVTPMWFLPILMAVSIVYFVLRAMVKSEKVNTGIAAAIFLLAYGLMAIGRMGGVWRAMILVGTGLWMFHLGHLYRCNEEKIKRVTQKTWVIICCLIAEIGLSFIADVNIIQMRFSNPIFFTAGAVLGINIILWIAQRMEFGWLRYLGNNSLTVLEWHYWGAVLVTLIQAVIYKGEVNGIITYQGNRPIWFVVYMLFGICLALSMLGGKKAIKNIIKRS